MEYWRKRKGYVIGLEDSTIDACAVLEIVPEDCIAEPVCVQNAYPVESVQSATAKYRSRLFCYIEVLKVPQAERRKGVGSDLLTRCIQKARDEKAAGIFIIVNPEEELPFSMENWLHTKGFELIARQDGIPLMWMGL